MLEEERKYDVPSSFELPPLKGLKPKSGKELKASYYDTADLRLARAGASLRFRLGDELPWTVKLATSVPGVRQEISRSGRPGRPPAELRWLVTALTRGARLSKVAVLRSERKRWDLIRGGIVLAEIADDVVTCGDLRFRELEVELKDGPREVLSTVERALAKAGAAPGRYPSKLVHALGEPAQRPPDLVAPGDRPGPGDELTEQVTWAVRSHARRILEHDPLLRLGQRLPNGDSPVHQLRVGCRRLRSALRSFAPVLTKSWASHLRAELGWFAGVLGAARDAEVLRARLAATAAADPLAPFDQGDITAIDAALGQREAAALVLASKAMRTGRYVALTEELTRATQQVPFAKRARHKPSAGLAHAPWLTVVREAALLTEQSPDAEWHRLRLLVKRARYTAAAARSPRAAVKALARLQDLLGEHQDAAVAAQVWLTFAEEPALAVTAGRLYERERAAVRQARSSFTSAWRDLSATLEAGLAKNPAG